MGNYRNSKLWNMNIYVIAAIRRVQQKDQKAKVIFSYIVNWRLVLTHIYIYHSKSSSNPM